MSSWDPSHLDTGAGSAHSDDRPGGVPTRPADSPSTGENDEKAFCGRMIILGDSGPGIEKKVTYSYGRTRLKYNL